MSARKSNQPSIKPTTPPDTTVKDNLPAFLEAIFDDFINAHALITVAYRLIDEWDDEDRGAAVRVLGQGFQALNNISDKLEQTRVSYERLRGHGGAS